MANSDISGQITDESGTAIGSAEVYLWREDLAGAGGVVASTTADSSGNFSFTAHPDGSGSSESWHVAAKDPNANAQLQSAYGVIASPPTSVNSQFDVSITGTAPSPVAPGETLTVDASLTNSGTDSDTQTITLDIDNGVGQVDSSLEAAQGGASESTSLSWAVPSGQTEQDYQATVASADDTASQTVTVSGTTPSEADAKLSHRWLLADTATGTATDAIGSADGAVNGVSAVNSTDYAGGQAASGDGADDYIATTPLNSSGAGDFIADHVASGDAAFAFTVDDVSSPGMVLGEEHNGTTAVHLNIGGFFRTSTTGPLNFVYRGDSGALGDVSNIKSSTDLSTGGPYRVVVNVTGTSESDIGIWVNQTDDNPSVAASSGVLTSVTGYQNNMSLFARNDNGTPHKHLGATLDDVCLFNAALTQSEIKSYDNPWV